MNIYDLALAWNWEFDADYIHGLERELTAQGVTSYQIRPDNLASVLLDLRERRIRFKALYDRASDADDAFLPLVTALGEMRALNPHDLVAHAIDKATMHLECISHGIHVPRTVILSPFRHQEETLFGDRDVDWLGTPFVIKPANTTGGGTGVVVDATKPEDVAAARRVHPDDKYLVQEFIHPKNIDGRRAWFRAYSVVDEILLCWWDDQTHEYSALTTEEEHRYSLHGLREVMKGIKQLCRLDFFSSEVALTADGRYIVVDYVNEICDMRLKSRYRNGAPDEIVHQIQRRIAKEVAAWVKEDHARD